MGGSLSDENGYMTLEHDGRRAAAAGTAMGGDSYYIFGYYIFADKELPFPARNAVHTDAPPRPFPRISPWAQLPGRLQSGL